MPLHVAVDCRVVDPHFPGIGRATLETVRALVAGGAGHRLSLLTAAHEPPPALAQLGQSRGVQLVAVGAGLRGAADQWKLPLLLRRLQPDVYHATYYAVPVAVPGRVVVTIYDLIPRLFPEYWPNPVQRAIINGWTSLAARRADRIIACSRSTADDVAHLLPTVRAKVRVAPLGVSPRAGGTAPAHADGSPFLLYVGSNKPHKNLPRLIAAFARIAADVDGTLVIAGAWDERYPEARDDAQRRALEGRVAFEPHPTDARLDELYAAATGFVFPSLYEGFGLPVLEAMAAGLPVAVSSRSSLREVAGDAALLFDPTDEAGMAAAMRRLLTDATLRRELRAMGAARAAQFPWSRTAADTLTVYEEMACASSTSTRTSTR